MAKRWTGITIALWAAIFVLPGAGYSDGKGTQTGSRQKLGLIAGTVTGSSPEAYDVAAVFGVEQYEAGVLSTVRHQVWQLTCSHRTSTYCGLERTVMDDCGSTLKTIITSHHHSSDDGSLTIKKADWRGGTLLLTLLHRDDSKTDVMVKLQRQEGTLYLTSFKAIGVGTSFISGNLQSVEYRIPEYTYTLTVPVEMRGFRREQEKDLDQLFSTLSQDDIARWKIVKEDRTQPSVFDEPRLRAIVGDNQKEATPAQMDRIYESFLNDYRQWLSKTGLSSQCVTKILTFLRQSDDNVLLLLTK